VTFGTRERSYKVLVGFWSEPRLPGKKLAREKLDNLSSRLVLESWSAKIRAYVVTANRTNTALEFGWLGPAAGGWGRVPTRITGWCSDFSFYKIPAIQKK
jgi:hypothetical protein